MRALIALTVLLGGDVRLERMDRIDRMRTGSVAAPPLFEFAPANGTGMGAACACTTPTGSAGETLTFTRASSGTCLKGGTTTDIANGDMVTCSTNEPRVMPGGDGSGGLGLLVEGAVTNVCLRSQEFENAAWTLTQSGSSNPVVTANQAVAPDGTTTADRVQFAAAVAGFSVIYQSAGSGAYAGSFFIKGNGTSGTIQADCHTGASDNCTTCSYNASTWTRCSCTAGAGTPLFIIGPNPAGCGGGAQSAADVFLWGAQIEAGSFATSYIATTGAGVARETEAASVEVTAGIVNAAGSVAATVNIPNAAGGMLNFANSTYRPLYAAGVDNLRMFDGTTVLTAASLAASTVTRVWSSWTGATMTVTNATTGIGNTGAFDGDMMNAKTTMEIGTGTTGAGPINSVIKQVCLDSSPTRCR